MAKKRKTIKKKPSTPALSRLKPKVKRDLLARFDAFIDNRHTFFKWFFTILGGLFALLMFEGKISVGFDDALYIQSAANYVDDFFGFWHTANAPFYVFILTIPIAIFGINLIIIKFISVLFFVLSIFYLYKTFENRIPGSILFFSIFIYSINWAALTYASLTYQEACYMFIQALFFYWFFRFLETKEVIKVQFQPFRFYTVKPWIILGLLLFVLYFTRTVGIAAVVACAIFFIWHKKFQSALLTVGSTLLVIGTWEAIKRIFWGAIAQSTQSSILFQKDAYDASKGNEDFVGFVIRFLQNTEIFFSQRFLEILSIRPEYSSKDPFLTILTLLPIVIGILFSIFKKNKYLLFTALYCLGLCSLTFLVLQTSWAQIRLILIYLPFFLILAFYGLYHIFKFNYIKKLQIAFFLPVLFLLYINLSKTFTNVKDHLPIAEANLIRGDLYKGFTPDWVNYLKMSEWCGKNLPESSFVACRKAPMSFIYANGKKFYNIARASPEKTPEEKLQMLQDNGVTHIIIATLRADPTRKSERVINTIHRFVQPISQKYPQKFRKIHQEGTDESAVLYEIIY